ncbi:MAG TPA: RagB/SusD family nutrient uptake outer membrane protein [Bacteroidales bacterium]|nr:RagB/SusD family nutrient uptake outer membrane protein [Bacteroidales bacterium]
MKNLLKYTLLVLMTTVILSSCEMDRLEPEPFTAAPEDIVFDTRAAITAQVTGIYAAFRSGQYLGGRYQVYNDIRSGDWLMHQSNAVTGMMTWFNATVSTTGEVQELWNAIYHGIGRINFFLDGMAANRDTILARNILTLADFNALRGEALALRGLAYFHLVQLYAQPFNHNSALPGAILRLSSSRTLEGNNMARSTLAQTYAQILRDLTDGFNLLPVIPANSGNTVAMVTRMHRSTIKALKTRVYLHMNDWTNVRAWGDSLVSATAPFTAPRGVAYGLSPTFVGIWLPPYTSRESIFSMPFNASELPGTQNGLAHYFSAFPFGNNEYSVNVAGTFWTDFPANDARRQLVLSAVVAGTARTFINKFPTFPHSDWAPVIRYAEVMLNVAEAEARLIWPNPRAVALLNAVWRRSNPGASDLTFTDDAAGRTAFFARLLAERRIEFLGEGIRSMDMTRNLLPFGTIVVGTSGYVWPIPESERITNALVQPN